MKKVTVYTYGPADSNTATTTSLDEVTEFLLLTHGEAGSMESEETVTIRVHTMTMEEYEGLPEFCGF